MLWSAEEMLDRHRHRMDILAHAGIAHNGPPQKRKQKSWIRVSVIFESDVSASAIENKAVTF